MKNLIVLCFSSLLFACGSATLEKHSSTSPQLKLEEFFSGELKAYGMVLDRSGNLLRRFEVDLVGQWEGNEGDLAEWFLFDDGERSTRTWKLKKINDNTYQGTASDVVGIAEGRTEGSALHWVYELDIEVNGSIYQVTLDDWMFLIDEKRLFNKTDMSKWGFHVGEVVLYIEKR